MSQVLEIVGMLVALAALAELFHRVRALAWLIFVILPPILLPLWIRNTDEGWFFSVKILIVLSGVVWLIACRDTRLGDKAWSRHVTIALMGINLAELVFLDLRGGTVGGWLNAVAGALLIATIPGVSTIHIHPRRDFLWDIPYGWVITYTLWDWTFVYLNFPTGSGHAIALLGAPLLIALWKRQRWVLARAFVLGGALILKFTVKPLSEFASTPDWYVPWVGVLAASLALAGAILHAAFTLSAARKAPPKALEPLTD